MEMIKIEFLDGKEPLEIEADTLKEAVEKAISEGKDLSWANLRGADLSEADLQGADLRETDLSGADLSWADLSGADLHGSNLSKTDLHGSNLSWAYFQGADLSRSNIDFSCWPLRCGSLGVKIDKRIFCQLLYHALRAGQSVDDPEVKRLFEIPEIVNLANKFHRGDECGKIEVQNGKN